MPVLSRCPLCRAVMPETRGECRCRRCGELVLPAVRKLCAVCGGDLTHSKKVRDDTGEYFCHDCWDQRLAARGEQPGYICRTCRHLFPPEAVYQDGDEVICHGCHAHQTLDPNALMEAAATTVPAEEPWGTSPTRTRAARRQADPIPWAWVAGGIAFLIVAAIVLVVYWSRT